MTIALNIQCKSARVRRPVAATRDARQDRYRCWRADTRTGAAAHSWRCCRRRAALSRGSCSTGPRWTGCRRQSRPRCTARPRSRPAAGPPARRPTRTAATVGCSRARPNPETTPSHSIASRPKTWPYEDTHTHIGSIISEVWYIIRSRVYDITTIKSN